MTGFFRDSIISASGGSPQFSQEAWRLPEDWFESLKLAGRSFGTTVLVLLILATVCWVVGLVLQKREAKKGEQDTGGEAS
ncbi:MAG: hypothetical protein DRI40_06260 [Chloroflexi bacterium]|nr:MAG: hypothetical protein DRI40_06260 [Chloroflexota bacterium]